MDEFSVNLDAKNLRKAAFAVAFGLTVGKAVGDLASAVIGGGTEEVIKLMAKHGNGAAQKACENSGIKYTSKTDIGDNQK